MYGLVLEGGGGKGGYHIGVWKALRELNIEIAAVTGTSVGALNGAFITQGRYEEAYALWYNMDPSLVINTDADIHNDLINFKIDIKNWDKYFEYLKELLINRGLDVEPLKNLIKKYVDEDAIRNSSIEFGLVTVSLTDRKPVEIFVDEIPNGKLADYLLASSYLPAFKTETIDDKYFIDGGFYDNLPINLIYNRGYKNIIAVDMKSIGRKQSVKNLNIDVTKIIPSGDLGMMLDFGTKQSRKNILMGYLDTLKVFGKYEGDKYFLDNVPDESFFINYLLELEDEQIIEMAKEIGVSEGSPKRLLLEKLIPEFSKLFGLDINSSYKVIVIKFIELLAVTSDIERLKVYTFEELRKEVFNKFQADKTSAFDFDKVPNFLKKSYLFKYSLKKDLLINWAKIVIGVDKL